MVAVAAAAARGEDVRAASIGRLRDSGRLICLRARGAMSHHSGVGVGGGRAFPSWCAREAARLTIVEVVKWAGLAAGRAHVGRE